MQIPRVAQFGADATLVQFFWCWSCEELFAYVGDKAVLAASFAKDKSQQWRVWKVIGSEHERNMAVSVVTQVDPRQLQHGN